MTKKIKCYHHSDNKVRKLIYMVALLCTLYSDTILSRCIVGVHERFQMFKNVAKRPLTENNHAYVVTRE